MTSDAVLTRIEKLKNLKAAALRPQRLSFVRHERKRAATPKTLIAYDFETTRIEAGTPRPLYLTAYSERPEFAFEGAIKDMQHLRVLLETRFLTDELLGVSFVGWNANNFDAYFVCAALLDSREWVLRPYLTRSNSLRGVRVIRAEDANKQRPKSWEFLDGIAMLGLVGTSLEKFLDNFAPEYRKLSGTIDFEREEFDPNNPAHRAYAMRDSVGLWHGMTRAQNIILDRFNEPLRATMGSVAIKVLQAHLPRDVEVRPLTNDVLDTVRRYVVRGGFCYCARRYYGPVWKYDLNQAYAAAMREAKLPCGRALMVSSKPKSGAWIARVNATRTHNKIPFYYRTMDGARMRSQFAVNEIFETWLTSIELEQLHREGWSITYHEFIAWEDTFNLSEFVDKLEVMRKTCEGGPSGPAGTMIKAVGNHSYGKTLEELDPVEFLLSKDAPAGYEPFYSGDSILPVQHLWFRPLTRTLADGSLETDEKAKGYHQPHIGAFITAHVRMVVRRAALLLPDAWIYADTDCVMFTQSASDLLDIDAKRYGAWKIEDDGTVYRVIAKKVYAEDTQQPKKKSAKGLHVKKLVAADFAAWYDGDVPVQTQVQRNNFVAVMQGREMYRSQTRRGTKVAINTGSSNESAGSEV